MKKVVAFCTGLAMLCCLTAYASTTPSQAQDGKGSLGTRRPAKPAAATHRKAGNAKFDSLVKPGALDVSKVQKPAGKSDKSVEHASPLKAEYQSVIEQIKNVQSKGGDISALRARAAGLRVQIEGHRGSEYSDGLHTPHSPMDQGGETCATATVIGGLPYFDTGTTLGHTDDIDVIAENGGSAAPDVMYSFTPSSNMSINADLCHSWYDTKIGIFDAATGAQLCANDDACDNADNPNDDYYQSAIYCCQLEANHTYCIVVDGYCDECAGDYELYVSQCAVPANDLCANAEPLAIGTSVSGSTVYATIDSGPDCYPSIDAGGVWYLVIGDGSTLTVSTCNAGTDYDSKLNVYTCGCDHLSCVTGNDDDCGLDNTYASTASWCSLVGELYWVLVQGYGGSVGNFVLTLSSDEVACDGGVICPCWDATLEAPGSMTGTLDGQDGDCYEGCADYSVQVTIPSDGMWNFSLCGSDFDTYLYVGTSCCQYDVCANDDDECDGQFTVQSHCCVQIPAGVYYVTIFNYDCVASGNFVLTVSPCAPPQTGETCADAIQITGLPYTATGTTIGHNDDIDPDCEYGTSQAPDVVYGFSPTADIAINVDLCGAYYDSKVFVIDAETGEVMCCNDDACDNPNYDDSNGFQSYIGCCHLYGGHHYCIVVDGYCSDCSGDYTLIVTQAEGCGGCVVCPEGGVPEGEECGTDVNGGCNTEGLPTTPIVCGEVVCGTSYALNGTRDTDFYELVLTQPSTLNWCVYADFVPQVAIVSTGTLGCDDNIVYSLVYGEAACALTCASTECLQPGTYWLFVAPVQFDGVPCSNYIAHVECTPCGGCNPTPYVQMTTTPVPQYQCAQLCPGAITGLVICGDGVNPNRMPIVTITPGCNPQTTRCDVDCDPATAFEYNPAGWVIDGNCWYNHIIGASGGCVCVCLEGFLGVEFNHDFVANATDGAVALSWSTASESNNARFDIVRNGETVGQVPASNITTGHAYTWTDNHVQNGTSYSYTLVAVDVNNNRQELATTNALPTYGAAVISEYALHQNFPNPFNPETNITFDLVDAGNVSLAIYNLMGQQVATVMNGQMAAGRHTVSFNAATLPSGVYVYKLNVNGFAAEKKMMLMK